MEDQDVDDPLAAAHHGRNGDGNTLADQQHAVVNDLDHANVNVDDAFNDLDGHVDHNKLDLSAPDPTQIEQQEREAEQIRLQREQEEQLEHERLQNEKYVDELGQHIHEQHLQHNEDSLNHGVGPSDQDDDHAAFLPSLQFNGSNDLLETDYQSPAGGPMRTNDADAAQANFDHWPTEAQVSEHDSVNQFSHHPAHASTPYDRPPPSGTTYGTYEGAKPKRKRASPQQLTLLNNIFEMTYFPSSDLRLAIGKELDMAPRSVQIWFQNRRSLWRAKATQMLTENKARKEELLAAGISEEEADQKINLDRQEAAAKQIADQRANDAVEYAINGTSGSLAYALHGASPITSASFDDGSITRDDEAGAWSVLQAFHQARTGQLVPAGHNARAE